MANYCQAAKISRHLDITDTHEQSHIRELCEEATTWVDLKLKNYTTTPLTTVPDRIEQICTKRVELKYRIDKSPSPQVIESLKARLEIVNADLEEFIKETYKRSSDDIPFFVVEADS